MTSASTDEAHIGSGSLWMAAAQVVSLAGAFAVLTVASRRLDQTGYGLFTMMTMFVAIGSVMLLGIPQAMVLEVAHLQTQGNRAATLETIGSGQAILLAVTGSTALIAMLLAPWAHGLVEATPGSAAGVAWSVRIAALTLLATAVGAGADATLQGLQQFRTLALRDIAASVAGTLLTLTALFAGASLPAVISTTALAPMLTLLLSASAVRARGLAVLPLARATPASALRLLRFGLPVFVNEAIYLVHTRLDALLLLVLWSRDPRFVGFYSAALYLAVTALLPPRLLMRTFFPMVAALTARGELATVAARVRRSCGYLALLVVPIVTGGVCLATPILAAVFGPDFAVAGPALALLLVGYGANALTYPYTAALLGLGHPRAVMANAMPTAAAILALHLVLIPRYGMTGAAVGASLPVVVGLLAFPWQTARALRTHRHAAEPWELLPGAVLAKSVAAAAIMAAALLWMGAGAGAASLAATVAIGAAIYIAVFLVVLRGLTAQDWRLLAALWRGRSEDSRQRLG